MSDTQKDNGTQEPGAHGFRVQRLVRVLFPCCVHYVVFVFLWCVLGKLAEQSEMIQHPAWWMVYGYGVVETCWFTAEKVKKNIQRRLIH